jgi:hypothetical protein
VATFERAQRFDTDWAGLTEADKQRFRVMIERFVADLTSGEFRRGLRVKRVQGTEAIFAVAFAPHGRATWEHGAEVRPGQPHIIWRRVATLDAQSPQSPQSP